MSAPNKQIGNISLDVISTCFSLVIRANSSQSSHVRHQRHDMRPYITSPFRKAESAGKNRRAEVRDESIDKCAVDAPPRSRFIEPNRTPINYIIHFIVTPLYV